MSINKIRSVMYVIAKYLGDIQALSKSSKSGSASPIFRRILRRMYGKFASRGFNLFK